MSYLRKVTYVGGNCPCVDNQHLNLEISLLCLHPPACYSYHIFVSLNGEAHFTDCLFTSMLFIFKKICCNRLKRSINITLHLPLDKEWHYRSENKGIFILMLYGLATTFYVNYDFTFANSNLYFLWILSLLPSSLSVNL